MTSHNSDAPVAATKTPADRFAVLQRALFYGFGASLSGWIIAYALRLPGDFIPPIVLGLTLIAVQILGSVMAGRSAGANRAMISGVVTGVIAGIINLLIVLSAFSGERSDDDAMRPLYAAAAYLPTSAVLGAIAGFFGGKLAANRATPPGPRNWIGRFAILNAAGALVLLSVGGIVTSAAAGLAVPDWPASFGANMFLFPLSRMTGGVFIEHAHRLLAVLVGLTTATLLVWTLVAKVRFSTKAVAVIASVLVITQAVMGGLRVTQADPIDPTDAQSAVQIDTAPDDASIELQDNAQSRVLGLLHGVTGQVYVAVLALLAAMLSTTWRSDAPRTPHQAAKGQRRLNLFALIALVIQIGFGAAVRHFDLQNHALMSHLGWSIVVLILLLAAGMRGQKRLGDVSSALRRSAVATRHTVLLQMILGVIALVGAMMYHDQQPPPALYIIMRSPHQAIGCVLLISMTLLTAWTIRTTRPADPPASAPA